MAIGLSILSGIPLSYAMDTGEDITMMLLLPAAIGIACFRGIFGRLLGIICCYFIAIPSTFVMSGLFMRSLTHGY